MLFIIILNDTYCILMLFTEVFSPFSSCSSSLLNLENLRNTMNVMKNSSMENFHLDCLDQLVLVVHLPTVSVTNTN